MDNLQIGHTLYVLASNKHSFYPVEIINIKKEYEKEVFPERYLTITTKADTDKWSGVADFFPEDFGKIIFTTIEEVKEHIVNKDINEIER